MDTQTKSDIIKEVFLGVPDANHRKKDSRTIRNTHTRGTASWYSDRLDADRESAVVALCKFTTGKRKKNAVAALSALSNAELIMKAQECGFVSF